CKTRGRSDRYSFLVRLFHPLLHAGLSRRTEIAMLRQLWAAHCEVGLARYAGSIPQQFDFRPNRKGFNTPNVLKHSLENREAVECISEFAMLLRVCDRQSP